ncbi:MAG: hypothetical protein Q8Q52_05410 [Acidimicrobiia bacterium]|nr:hypothetical protein [Acidimicrobiia bacterium]
MAEPTRDEISRVYEWWHSKRARLAKTYGEAERDVPPEVVWHLADHGPLSAEEIEWVKRVAVEAGAVEITWREAGEMTVAKSKAALAESTERGN